MQKYTFEVSQMSDGGIYLVHSGGKAELNKSQVKDLGIALYDLDGFDRGKFNDHYKDDDNLFKSAEESATDIIRANCDDEELGLAYGSIDSFIACDNDMFERLVQEVSDNPDYSKIRYKFDDEIINDLQLYNAITNELKAAEIMPEVFRHIRDILNAYDNGIITVREFSSDISFDVSKYKGNSAFARDIICWNEWLRENWDFKELIKELTEMYKK